MDVNAVVSRGRWINGIAIVRAGHAAGELVPPDVGLAGMCEGSRGILFDMAGNDDISSAVLGQIIRTHQVAAYSDRIMRLCCPPGWIRETLTELRLDYVLPIYDTLADALAAWNKSED